MLGADWWTLDDIADTIIVLLVSNPGKNPPYQQPWQKSAKSTSRQSVTISEELVTPGLPQTQRDP